MALYKANILYHCCTGTKDLLFINNTIVALYKHYGLFQAESFVSAAVCNSTIAHND